MSNPDQSNYVLDLKELDVLCGRGSGPNDRPGNIEFRNLILKRKAEYLAAKTREVKGRIASDIVNNVRQRGGRFLRKLSPDQAKDAGFKRGVAVYELADEQTVLEKAKQTLRQNRAAFEKQNQAQQQGNFEGGQGTVPDFDVLQSQFDGNAANFSAAANIGMVPTGVMDSFGGSSGINVNPIPLDQASYLLDSDKLPQMGSMEARQLQNALFNSSSISSKNMNNADQMKLSMDLSMLLGSMASNNNCGSHLSNVSADAFGSLIKDFTAQDQASLVQQYESLQLQQQQALMQQYEIMKKQHEQMVQNMYPQLGSGNPNDINPSQANMNMQHDMNMNVQQHTSMNIRNNVNMNGQGGFNSQCHQNFSPQSYVSMYNGITNGMNLHGQQNMHPPELTKGSSITSTETSVMNNFSEDSLSRYRNMRGSDELSSSVFGSLMREYQQDPTLQDQYQNSQYDGSDTTNTGDLTLQQHYLRNQPQSNEYTKQRTNEISQTSKESIAISTIGEFTQLSQDPVINDNLGKLAREQEFSEQQKLLQQYASLQSSGNESDKPTNQNVNLSVARHSGDLDYIDYDTRLNDDDGIVRPPPSSAPSPLQKRKSRKQKEAGIDQSLTLSFVTGKNLESKLKDDAMNLSRSSMKSSTTSSNKISDPRDSSLLSLMSMSISLSEISHDLPTKHPGESFITRASLDKNDTIEEGVKESSQELGVHDMSLASLGDGWALDENDQTDKTTK